MSIRTSKDLEGMKRVGRVVAATLREMKRAVRPGITTAQLDEVAAQVFRGFGARSGPQICYEYPALTCISVNDEAVHGVPDDRELEPGDLVKLDVTAELQGYMADAAITVPVGEITPEAQALSDCARKAFYEALNIARHGEPVREWGRVVEREVRAQGFSVLKELFGHGVGRNVHEPPRHVPQFNDRKTRDRFIDGTTVALEPIISISAEKVTDDPDGWTLKTVDGSLSAHFEHTVLITRGKPLVLTAA